MSDLSRETLREIYKVLDLESLGETGFRNVMSLFESSNKLCVDGNLTESGHLSLMNLKENCDKIFMWESLE